MHLLREQTPKAVMVKCGRPDVKRAETTVWWSEVDCIDCNPMRWVPAPDGLGQMMVDLREAPPKKVLKRRRT